MKLIGKERHFEDFHIFLWLIKDTCWMMEFKKFGVIMVLPTIAVAVYIALITRKTESIFINLAVLCWISANSYWMVVEFYFSNHGKVFAIIPFLQGMIFALLHYYKIYSRKN